MFQSFLTDRSLDDNLLIVLGIALMPSIVGLLLAFFALGLPDDSA